MLNYTPRSLNCGFLKVLSALYYKDLMCFSFPAKVIVPVFYIATSYACSLETVLWVYEKNILGMSYEQTAYLLLLYLLSVGSAHATQVEARDVSFGSNLGLEISPDENKPTAVIQVPQASQLISETDASPPTLWVVGLGLCLVFFGYKTKKNRQIK